MAYLVGGTVHLLGDGCEVRPLESKFAQEARARATRIAQRNAWKTRGSGARFMMGLGGMPDAHEILERGPTVVAFVTGLARGARTCAACS